MLGRTGLSGMRWDIQMDRVAESNSSTGYGCEVTQKTRRDLKDGFDKVLIMHCEKPVREADATCSTLARLTAL